MAGIEDKFGRRPATPNREGGRFAHCAASIPRSTTSESCGWTQFLNLVPLRCPSPGFMEIARGCPCLRETFLRLSGRPHVPPVAGASVRRCRAPGPCPSGVAAHGSGASERCPSIACRVEGPPILSLTRRTRAHGPPAGQTRTTYPGKSAALVQLAGWKPPASGPTPCPFGSGPHSKANMIKSVRKS